MYFRAITLLAVLAIVACCQAQQAAVREFKADDLKSLSWRSIGPANMGGRVADICLAPGNSKEFFVGFGVGGVWKTTNAGNTLSPVFDHEVTNSIGSVAVADAPPNWRGWKDEKLKEDEIKEKGKAKIVWVGSGEGNGRNSSSWGHGVYRSTDGGSSFKSVGLEDSHDIPRLAVDPRDPDVCYVAALGHLWGLNKMRGVYKTEDGGKTWKPSLQINENTGAIDVIIDPNSPDTVYAAMYMRRRTPYSYTSGGKDGGIYKSTDAGRHWAKLTTGLPAQTGRIGLDIYRKNPKIVYALIESDQGGTTNIDDDRSRSGGLFRSDDSGASWTRLHGRVPRAFYFSKVKVDPTDDQRVYICGFGVDVSDDGGHTFRRGMADALHGDVHAFVIDPADHDHLLLGDDGGLFQSYDRGENWEYLNTMAVGQFYNVALDNQEPYHVLGGLQDNGSWLGPSTTMFEIPTGPKSTAGITNADWKMITDSDGFHCGFDNDDPNILYTEGQGGGLSRTDLRTGRTRGLTPVPKEGQPGFRFNWNSPFVVSQFESQTLFLGGNYVFKLTKRGDEWERISPDLTKHEMDKDVTTGSNAETYGTIVALAESPCARGVLWAGSDDGLIHVTEDDGANWRNVTPKEVGGHYVAKLRASKYNRRVVYAVIDKHRDDDMDPLLLMSQDLGQSWRNITGDLPKGWSTKAICEDLNSPTALFCGTQQGIYFSANGGTTWIKMNGSSLPTVPVEDIVEHPGDGDLVIATHGRSIWIWDDATALSQLRPTTVQSELYLFDIGPAKPQFRLYNGQVLANKPFRAGNAPLGAKITYWVKTAGDDVAIEITDAKGHKVRSLSGPGKAGLSRVIWDLQPEENMRVNGNGEEPGQPIFVSPGTYTVALTMGKNTVKKTVAVKEAPPGNQAVAPRH